VNEFPMRWIAPAFGPDFLTPDAPAAIARRESGWVTPIPPPRPKQNSRSSTLAHSSASSPATTHGVHVQLVMEERARADASSDRGPLSTNCPRGDSRQEEPQTSEAEVRAVRTSLKGRRSHQCTGSRVLTASSAGTWWGLYRGFYMGTIFAQTRIGQGGANVPFGWITMPVHRVNTGQPQPSS
jgi:hypothetical protein